MWVVCEAVSCCLVDMRFFGEFVSKPASVLIVLAVIKTSQKGAQKINQLLANVAVFRRVYFGKSALADLERMDQLLARTA